MRRTAALKIIVSVAAALLLTGPLAFADPSADSSEPSQAYCDFTLTAPHVVQLPGGAPAVTATMSPNTCHGAITVTDVSVCVSQSGGASQCNSAALNTTVQVYLPSDARGTFTSHGRLCGITLSPDQTTCMTAGPYSKTL